jgi:CBS domain-containing protein
MEDILVRDIMTKNPVYVKPKTNLIECAKKMAKERVGSLLLLEDNELQGIITEKDIIWALSKKSDISEIKASDVASRKIIWVKPKSTVDEALEKMSKKRVRRLPVISNKKIIGYVTLKDLLKFKPSLFQSIDELEKIKDETKKIKKPAKNPEGICDECGKFDFVSNINNRMICESCRKSS